MDIERIIREIEDILDSSWQVPMSGGKVLVDSSEIIQALQDLRLMFPKEITQAKNIVADRDKILGDARKSCESVYKITEEKIRGMLDENEITKRAKSYSEKILKEARQSSEEMKSQAKSYINELIVKSEKFFISNLEEIRKTRQLINKKD
ncbi:MAG: hypothetical protein LBK29_01180 [Oscillospiraceae bacterium]|jgi:isocitrate lyase|nr:hypothetical protein [Oscillospiraceae bacterium]